MIGDTVSHYRILDKLGQGGMGEVFLALDTSLNRKVALKFLTSAMSNDPSARQRLLREAKLAAALDRPFICKVYEASHSDGQDFIAMDYVEGKTLRDVLAKGPMTGKDFLRVAREIAEALEAAHEQGIVHRDLKPSNIMLGRGGHIKVMDFGLAKQLPVSTGAEAPTSFAVTGLYTVVGTLDYMAPEIVMGKPADARSDVFSFGLVLCELLTGTHPLRRSTAPETAAAIVSAIPVPLPIESGTTPSFLRYILRRMLEKDPDLRYQSVKDLLADLSIVPAEAPSGAGRRLAAILSTDIVGYSVLTHRNESLAMEVLEEHRRLLRLIRTTTSGLPSSTAWKENPTWRCTNWSLRSRRAGAITSGRKSTLIFKTSTMISGLRHFSHPA